MSDPLDAALKRLEGSRLAYIQGQVERQEQEDAEPQPGFYGGYNCSLGRSLVASPGGSPGLSQPQTNGMFAPGQAVSGSAGMSAGRPAGVEPSPSPLPGGERPAKIRILFSKFKDGFYHYYIGGDRPEPRKIYSSQTPGFAALGYKKGAVFVHRDTQFLTTWRNGSVVKMDLSSAPPFMRQLLFRGGGAFAFLPQVGQFQLERTNRFFLFGYDGSLQETFTEESSAGDVFHPHRWSRSENRLVGGGATGGWMEGQFARTFQTSMEGKVAIDSKDITDGSDDGWYCSDSAPANDFLAAEAEFSFKDPREQKEEDVFPLYSRWNRTTGGSRFCFTGLVDDPVAEPPYGSYRSSDSWVSRTLEDLLIGDFALFKVKESTEILTSSGTFLSRREGWQSESDKETHQRVYFMAHDDSGYLELYGASQERNEHYSGSISGGADRVEEETTYSGIANEENWEALSARCSAYLDNGNPGRILYNPLKMAEVTAESLSADVLSQGGSLSVAFLDLQTGEEFTKDERYYAIPEDATIHAVQWHPR